LARMEQLVIALPILIFSVVVHEYAHGYVALRQGDQTALMLGRLTLNPVPHLDPIGSFIVPGLLALTGAPILGWAKPVPVNPRNFRNYKRGDILVSLAGVIANFGLAVIFLLLLVVMTWIMRMVTIPPETASVLAQMLDFGVRINIILILFNLLPIPPLDGSHVMYHLLPPHLAVRYREIGRYGFLILFALLFLTGFRFLLIPFVFVYSVFISFGRLLAGAL
jgi:Zn-dependent protease